eukprot:g5815.t1
MDNATVAVKGSTNSESPTEKISAMTEKFETASESPNNNNNTSASSSPKNERVASGLLKLLNDDSILAGLEDIPPSENLLDESGIYQDPDLTGVHQIDTALEYKRRYLSDDGSFVQSYSEGSENEETHSPLQFNNARQFELEFKLHEAEHKIEQLTLQLKNKSMQLEQVQVALISCEEEIMQIRNHEVHETGNLAKDQIHEKQQEQEHEQVTKIELHSQSPTGVVSLETAEQLSSKIIKLQQRVEELEDVMVITKLDNAQLKETNEFLKSKLKQMTKRVPEKKSTPKTSSVRNLFGRK